MLVDDVVVGGTAADGVMGAGDPPAQPARAAAPEATPTNLRKSRREMRFAECEMGIAYTLWNQV
jgi:hypothetical protein